MEIQKVKTPVTFEVQYKRKHNRVIAKNAWKRQLFNVFSLCEFEVAYFLQVFIHFSY